MCKCDTHRPVLLFELWVIEKKNVRASTRTAEWIFINLLHNDVINSHQGFLLLPKKAPWPVRAVGTPGRATASSQYRHCKSLVVLDEGSLHMKRGLHQMITETKFAPWKTCTHSHSPRKQWAAKRRLPQLTWSSFFLADIHISIHIQNPLGQFANFCKDLMACPHPSHWMGSQLPFKNAKGGQSGWFYPPVFPQKVTTVLSQIALVRVPWEASESARCFHSVVSRLLPWASILSHLQFYESGGEGHLAAGELIGKIKGFPWSIAKCQAFHAMLWPAVRWPHCPHRHREIRQQKAIKWLYVLPENLKKREERIKAPGFSHSFASEQWGNLPFQRRYYLEEVGSGAGSFITPMTGFLSLETILVYADQVLCLSQDIVKRSLRPVSDWGPRVPGNTGTSLSFLVPPHL